jgi:tellurite resistance protein TehA-like permease
MAPVGLATAGAEAGFITIYSYEMSARLAVPQLVVGYFALGVAFFMGVILYAIYIHRLLAAGFTAPAKRPSMFILVGPAGQLSTAFLLLGESAAGHGYFAQYKPSSVIPPTYGTIWTQQTAQGLEAAGTLFAFLLLGFCYLMLCLAIIGVADVFVKKQASYSLSWWAMVFPLVTLTTAWLELASSMDSPAFRGLVSALTVFLFIAYFVNMGFTLRGIVNGSLIFGQTQLEREDALMSKAQAEAKKSDV